MIPAEPPFFCAHPITSVFNRLAPVRSLASNTLVLALAQGVGIGTRLIYIVAVARLLGPELYALLAYSQTWSLAFLPLALLGVGPALIFAIARHPAAAGALTATGLALRLTLTCVAVGVCVGLAFQVAPDPRAPLVITVLAGALAGRSLTLFAQQLYVAFEVNHHTLMQESVARAAELVLVLAVLMQAGGLLWLVAAQGLVWWLQAVWSLWVVRRDLVPLGLNWQWTAWQPLLAFALPLFVTALSVDWRVSGPLILFRNLNPDPVLFGQFSLAMQALFILATLAYALGSAAQPLLTRSAQRGDGQDLRYASGIQRLAFLLGGAAGLLGQAFGPQVFRGVLGEAYGEAGQLTGLTLWCLIPLLAGIGFPAVLLARGRLLFATLVSVLGAVTSTLLVLWLTPRFGVAGAIVGAACGFSLPPLLIYGLALAEGWTDVWSTGVRPAAAVGAALLVWRLLPGDGLLPLCLSLATLAGGAWLLGLVTPEEQASLVQAWRGRGPPGVP